MDNTRQELPPTPPSKAKIPWFKVFLVGGVLAVVAAALALVLRLTVFNKHSKEQIDSIPIFRLDSTNVDILQLSPSELSGTWDIGLSIQNPNADNVLYQRMDISLYYRQQLLAKTTLPSFQSDGGQAWKPVKAKLETGSSGGAAAILPDLEAAMASGSVNFDLGVYAGYYIGGESPKRVWSAVDAVAYNVNIEFSSGGRKGTRVAGGEMWKIKSRW